MILETRMLLALNDSPTYCFTIYSPLPDCHIIRYTKIKLGYNWKKIRFKSYL